MKWKKDDIRFEYRPFYILSFLLLSLFFILYSQAHQLRSSSFYFTLKLQIALSVWKHIIHASFKNIGNLIDFKE